MIKKKKTLTILIFKLMIIFILILLICLYFIRFISPREIDDITPEIFCEERLMTISDTLYVIPMFNNKSIAEDKNWCDRITALNKTLAMHGVYHTYEEFGTDRDIEYIKKGIEEFTKCFGYAPRIFKPPQLKLTKNNIKTLESLGLEVRTKKDQFTHRVFHCQDQTELFNNKFNSLF